MRASTVLRWCLPPLLGLVFQSQGLAQTGVRRTVFPHLVVGGGWSSEVFITNQHPQAASGVRLLVYDDGGDPPAVETDSAPQSNILEFRVEAWACD